MEHELTKDHELTELLSALQDGRASDEQMQRLNDILLADPEARRLYCQYVNMEDTLSGQIHGAALPGSKPESVVQPPLKKPARSRSTWVAFAAGLSVLAASILFVVLLQRNQPVSDSSRPVSGEESTDNTVALIAQTVGAQWMDHSTRIHVNSRLSPGTLKLQKGLVRVEFYSGATVILEGPAEFEIVSAMKARCAHGKLRAHVPPPASGFVIETPDTELVDLGTEFGMDVRNGRATDVVVFEGKVELYKVGQPRGADSRRVLTIGQSIRLAKSVEAGTVSPAPQFASRDTLDRDLHDQAETQRKQWLAGTGVLRKSAGAQVYYSLADETLATPGTLKNDALNPADASNGSIVGCGIVPGRWPWKKALNFSVVSDRVRLQIPGTFESLTLAAWVRVGSLPDRYGGLMMSDGFDEGAVHWQIDSEGKLAFSVQALGKTSAFTYLTPPVITADKLGQWLHVAVTYDRTKGTVTHFVNGKALSSAPSRGEPPIHIGTAELGNWFAAGHKTWKPIRNLTGNIDEFALFGRALDEHEIQAMYVGGADF